MNASYEKAKKPIFRRWWVWLGAVVIVIGIVGGQDESQKSPANTNLVAPSSDRVPASAPSDEIAVMLSNAPELTNDEIEQKVSDLIEDSLGADEEYQDIAFEHRTVSVVVNLSNATPAPLTYGHLVDMRLSSIGEAFLSDDALDNHWDSFNITFLGIQQVTLTSDDIITNDFGGRYFKLDADHGAVNEQLLSWEKYYEIADYAELSDPASENGLEGFPVQIAGIVRESTELDSLTAVTVEDYEGHEWAFTLPAGTEVLENKDIRVFGVYQGTAAGLDDTPTIIATRYVAGNELYTPRYDGVAAPAVFDCENDGYRVNLSSRSALASSTSQPQTSQNTPIEQLPNKAVPSQPPIVVPQEPSEMTQSSQPESVRPEAVQEETAGTVYWGGTGTKIHTNPRCRTLTGTVHSGTEEQAIAAGRTEGYCKVC
jgi:hypothetical protein